MCDSSPSLEYSPRRLVALFASTAGFPDGGTDEPDGGGRGGGASPSPSGPDPAAFMRNLRAPIPLGRKIRLVVRNTAIKAKTRQGCCGHPGEPGC